MAIRRFEYVKGSSNKFWEVWIDSSTVKTRYGKIGSTGQTSARKTPGPIEADELLDKLVDEKLRKGYQEKRPAKAAKGAKPAKAAKPTYRGKTFTGEDVSYSELEKADLSGSRWKRCNFDGVNLQRANLSGAVFEDCTFDLADLDHVRARGATFKRCSFDCNMRNADVRDAKFLDVAVDSTLDLGGSKAQGLQLQVAYSDPRSANRIDVDDADLRGATIEIELTGKAKTKHDWYRDHAESAAKTDGKTRIQYGALPGFKPAKHGLVVDEHGPSADVIGSLHAESASLWFLAIDAQAAAAWKGDDGYDEDEDLTLDENISASNCDFARAMKVADKKRPVLPVGSAQGVVATVGGCGWSHIWRIPDGIALLDYASGDDHDLGNKKTIGMLSRLVVQLPAKGKPKSLGTVAVKSGVLALLLPGQRGDIKPAQIAKAKAANGRKAVAANPSRVLVALPAGDYEVLVDRLDVDDDSFGMLESRVRIVRA